MQKTFRQGVGWGLLLIFLVASTGCVGGVSMIKAETKLAQKKYDEAIPLLEETIANKPNSVKTRGKLGFAYLKTGRIDDAVREFETVQKLEPGEPFSVLYLGLAYLNQEKYAQAIKTWEGYRNKRQPLVEAEIRRQLTLLMIAESQRLAEKALEDEKALQAIEPKDDTIAVFYYKDMSSEQDMAAFQKGLAAMVITDLSKISSLKVVERLRIQALLEEMQLGQIGVVDARSAPRIGRLLGAKNVIVGSLRKGSLDVATTVNDSSSSATVATDDFWQLPGFITQTAVQALDIELTPQQEAALGFVHTKSLEAFTFWGKGLVAQDAGNWQEAKDLYAQSLAADPLFGLAADSDEGCPDVSAPSISDLKAMPAPTLSGLVSQNITEAQTQDQEAGNSTDPSASEGSGSGGGGGSSGY